MVNELLASVILAIVQGITEWLPISSSGHLILFERLLGFKAGLTFDVALHFGTLMAVFVYFGKDIVDIIRDILSLKFDTENGRLGLLVLVATIPAAIVGLIFRKIFETVFSDLGIIALGFGITGIFLFISSLPMKLAKDKIKSGHFSYGKALLVGIAQIFALFPGISRSGITIGSGLLLGLSEKSAMKFSFLMSIPIIFGANILVIGNQTLPPSLILASIVSFIFGLGTLHLLYGKILVNRRNLRWFGLYAVLLAITIGLFVIFS